MKPKVVIWLDPGETTGCARWISDPVRKRVSEPDIKCWQVANCYDDAGMATLFDTMTQAMSLAIPYQGYFGEIRVGYEKFEFRHDERFRDKINYCAAEVIGATRYWRMMRSNTMLVNQAASTVKAFWTDAKIKHLGLWVPSLRHGMDALRHLLYDLSFGEDVDHTYVQALKGFNEV